MSGVGVWLATHEAQAIQTLIGLCRIPGVSTDPAFAAGIAQAAGFVAQHLTLAGFPVVEVVERFNGQIEAVLQSRHFRSGEELETTLHRSVRLCNQQLPQSALASKTPLQAMKERRSSRNCSGNSHTSLRDVTGCPDRVFLQAVDVPP